MSADSSTVEELRRMADGRLDEHSYRPHPCQCNDCSVSRALLAALRVVEATREGVSGTPSEAEALGDWANMRRALDAFDKVVPR